MNQTSKSMEKKIRSVKTWLDRAEQAYADDSAAKGQLQLMLAKAEMKHLDEQQDKSKSYLRYAMYALTLCLTLLALYFALTKNGPADSQPVNDGKPVVTDSVNSTTNSSPAGHLANPSGQGGTPSANAPNGTVTNGTGGANVVPAGSGTTNAASNASDSAASSNSTVSDSSDSGTASAGTANDTSVDESNSSGIASTDAASGNNASSTAEPVISNSQIQEAVREGGRSLRGQ